MICYLVCLTDEGGIADAERRGWTRLARTRFATPDKDDVRVVRRFSDMIPFPGVTLFIKAADFPEDPDEATQKDAYDLAKFVDSGHAEWVRL